MIRHLKGIILLVLFFQQAYSQHFPDSSAKHVATTGDRMSWIIPGLTAGGQLLLNMVNISHQISGDTLNLVIPTGLHHGGLLNWHSSTGQVVKLGTLLLKFRYYPQGGGSNGHWVSTNVGNTDTITSGMLIGWRALEWPRLAGSQPPINAWGSNNQWILADTALWLIEDSIGGNEIAGPDSMRIRYLGTKDCIVKNIENCFTEIFPSGPFTVNNSIWGNTRIESVFPINFPNNKLEIRSSITVQAPSMEFPDSVWGSGLNQSEWINLGDTVRLSHVRFVGKGIRRFTGSWMIEKGLSAEDSIVTSGSLIWAGDSSCSLYSNCLLDQLTVLSMKCLKLDVPIRLKKSNQQHHRQLQFLSKSTLMSDTSGIIWEGSNLGFGNVFLDNEVVLKLNDLSMRKLFPSGSRIKLLHQGDLTVSYHEHSQGMLEWPDSTARKLKKLSLGRFSHWEFGASFTNTLIDSVLEIHQNSTLTLPDGRFVQLSPSSLVKCEGTISCKDSDGLMGALLGSIRGGNHQILFSDSSQVQYDGGTQLISALPSYPTLLLGNTGVKTLQKGFRVKGSLSIEGSYTRLDADTATLIIEKDFEVKTTSGNGFTEGQSTLIFTSPQARLSVSGFQTNETVHQLIVNSGSRLKLECNLNVQGGGKLVLEPNAIIDADTMNLSGSGVLNMMAGSHLILRKTNDLLPGFSGNNSTYQIDSTAIIELAGNGNQVLRGSRAYGKLIFSNQGIKQLSSSLTQPPYSIEVKTGTALLTEQYRFGGLGTQLKLDSAATLHIRGIGTQPEAGGNWNLHPQALIRLDPLSNLTFNLRAKKSYPNLIIEKGNMQVNSRDSLSFLQGSSFLQIDSSATLKTNDSSLIELPSTGFTINLKGTLECRHAQGLFGHQHATMGVNIPSISTEGTVVYTRNQGIQRIDSLSFMHLKLSGNSLKLLPSRLEINGDITINEGIYTVPDSIMLIGTDTQKVQIPKAKHLTIRNSTKILMSSSRLEGALTITNGAKLRSQSNMDTLYIQHTGSVWTNLSDAVRLPLSWVYRHPNLNQGWRLAGFLWPLPMNRWIGRFNYSDTLNPTVRGLTKQYGLSTWASLSQKTLTAPWNDTLKTPFHEAWMLKCGPGGILRAIADSITLRGNQLSVMHSSADSTLGWRCISNPFLQDLDLRDTAQHHSSGIKQAFWRWGGLLHPGWQLHSPSMTLADSSIASNLTQLAPAQAALIYRVAPGQSTLKSVSSRSNNQASPSFRATQSVQHDIELTVRLGRRIRQRIGVKTQSGISADTLFMPPFPEGEKDVIGWFDPNNIAQGLILPELTSALTIPLFARSVKNDSLLVDIKINQLASGWQVYLYDSLTQQFHFPGTTFIKRIPFWTGQRLALYIIQNQVSTADLPKDLIYQIREGQITLTESADCIELYNLHGQLLFLQQHPSVSDQIHLPSGSPTLIRIKKGEKQWVNTVFRP